MEVHARSRCDTQAHMSQRRNHGEDAAAEEGDQLLKGCGRYASAQHICMCGFGLQTCAAQIDTDNDSGIVAYKCVPVNVNSARAAHARTAAAWRDRDHGANFGHDSTRISRRADVCMLTGLCRHVCDGKICTVVERACVSESSTRDGWMTKSWQPWSELAQKCHRHVRQQLTYLARAQLRQSRT